MPEIDSDAILETVRNRVDEIFNLMERLDLTVLEFYHDSPSFRYVGHSAEMGGPIILFYDAFCNAVKQHFEDIHSIKAERLHEHYNILSSTHVIYNMTGTSIRVTKKGDESESTLAVTIIFQLIDDEWKVILENGSRLPKTESQ